MGLVQLILILVVLGFVAFLVQVHAPISPLFKTIINFAIGLVGIVFLLEFAGFHTGLNIHL